MIELFFVLLLIGAGGFLSAAEVALLSADRGRLRQQAEAGDHRARAALEIADQPDRFLPAVRVTATFCLASAAVFAGNLLANGIAARVERLPGTVFDAQAGWISLVAVALLVTLFAMVLGELVPKRIGLQNPDGLARLASGPVHRLAQIGRPVVAVMNWMTDCLMIVFGHGGLKTPTVSVGEIQHLIERGTAEGVLEPVEQKLAVGALRLGEREARQIMHPRIDIDAVDIETPDEELVGVVAMSGFTRLPVYEGDLDHVIGIVHLKDVLRQHYLGWPINLRKLCHKPLFVPETMPLDQLLVALQKQHSQMALVVDEFGATKGLVTLDNVVTALAGELLAGETKAAPDRIVQRTDASWLVDGTVPVDELIAKLNLAQPESELPRNVTTLAGLVIAQLGRLPKVGEKTSWERLHFEVMDLDGQRVDKILVTIKAEGCR